MHYLLYAPGNIPCQKLRDWGLASLLAGGNPQALPVPEGPDGKAGTVFSWLDSAVLSLACYQPERQNWQPCKPCDEFQRPAGTFWIGVDKQQPPTPKELSLPRQHPGELVMLPDGNRWLIPVARQLPRVWGLDDNGKFCRRVVPEMKDYFETAETIHAIVQSGNGDDEFDDQRFWTFCVQALSLNYRLNEDIIDVLELLRDETVIEQGVPRTRAGWLAIVYGALEYQATAIVEADQKKTA